MIEFQATPRHHSVILALAGRIGAIPSVRRIVLFGSRARGDAEERSDVDLAIDAPDASREDWVRALELADEAETLLDIQLVRLHEAGEELEKRVAEEGIVLYERGKE